MGQSAATLPGGAAHRHRMRTLMGLYILALVIRAAAGGAIGMQNELDGDELEYFNAAVNLVSGRGYALVPQGIETDIPKLTAFRMPGPSLVMAASMAVFGIDVQVTRIVAILISSLSVPLMFCFAAKFTERRTALLAAFVCAVYPTWVFNSVTVKSEPYFVPMLLISLMCSVRAAETMTITGGTRVGILWGLTALIKPFGLPMMGLTALYLGGRSRCRRWSPSIAVGIAFCVTLSPWVIRNYTVFGQFVPLATEGSETFLGANNPYVAADPVLRGVWISPMRIPEYADALRPYPEELERAAARYRIALDYLKSDPGMIPKLMWWRIRRFFTPLTGSDGIVRIVVLCTYGTLMLLLAAGVILRVFRSTTQLHFVLLWVFAQMVVTAVYCGGLIRGRMLMEVVLLPWGAICAVALAGRLRTWRLFATDGRDSAAAAQHTDPGLTRASASENARRVQSVAGD